MKLGSWARPWLGFGLLHARQIEKRGEGLGPDSVQERKSLLFLSKSLFLFLFSKSILLFWKQYENSNFSRIFKVTMDLLYI
jgi:hypothetical protein